MSKYGSDSSEGFRVRLSRLSEYGSVAHLVERPKRETQAEQYSDTTPSADCKRGRRKGATSKNIKNHRKVSKSFATLFDNFRAGQKTSKIVKKYQKNFRHFSTIFARHQFSGPFWGALTPNPTKSSVDEFLSRGIPLLRAPWAEPTGMVSLSSGVPRLRDSSTKEPID